MKNKKKYWYKITYCECPVCGHSHTYKERQYSKKPKDPNKRYFYEIEYDYCIC